MESKRGERRSSLKHPDTTGIKRFGSSVETSRVNRRISFSGRKSVREFHSEEKPKTWNNSYEVSDHINTSDGSSEGYMKGAISKTQGKPNNLSLDYKENIASNNSTCEYKSLYRRKSLESLNKCNESSCMGKEDAKNTDENISFYKIRNEVIVENAAKKSQLTYFGNDAMVVDDRSMTNANKRLSIIQSMEMDISKEENVTLQTINNVEMVNDEEIETITRSFKDQLSSITFESMDNGKKTNKRKSTNKNVTMDISMNVEEPVKLQDVLNTEPQEYKYSDLVEEDTSLPHPLSQNTTTKISLASKEVVSRKFGTSDKKVLSEEIPELQNHQPICEDSIIKSKSDGLGLTVNSPSNMEVELDIKSNILSSISFNSPLFPPIMNKKLNFRQLNDDIGGGKIVIFPNKIVEKQIPNICIDSNSNMKPEVHNRECFENVADKINERSSADCTENEDMVSDSTSFLVKEKVGDDTVLQNHSICLDYQYRRNTIHCNSQIDTNYSSVEELEQENNINTLGMEKEIILKKPEQFDHNYKSIRKSIYEIQDMSLNGTNVQNISNDISNSIDLETAEFSNDVALQNDEDNIKKHTIYFNQDIEPTLNDELSLSESNNYSLELQSSNNKNIDEMKKEVYAIKSTPISKVKSGSKVFLMRQKALDTSDCGSDSFSLNLKEARTALSSNCKRRIEGTPHRSFLEFVYLERKVEQDNRISFEKECTETTLNVKHTRDANEGSKECNQNDFEKNEENKDKKVVPRKSTLLNKAGLKTVEIEDQAIPMIVSPISCQIINKRSTLHLTPNLPLPKKRQTLMFDDFGMDESICSDKIQSNDLIKSGNELVAKTDTSDESKCKQFDFQPPTEYGECSISLENTSIKLDVSNQMQTEKETFVELENSGRQVDCLESFKTGIPILLNHNDNEQKPITLTSPSSKINTSMVVDLCKDSVQLPPLATSIENRNSVINMPISSHDTTDDLEIENINYKIKNCALLENENSKKDGCVFEDNPITISDVSVHYLAQRTSNFMKIDKNDDKYDLTDSNKTAVFNKQFINLEREISPLCISQIDEIDKTRLSLVETLLSENADEDNETKELSSDEEVEVVHNCTANNHKYVPVEDCSAYLEEKNKTMDLTSPKAKKSIICRRCKYCQENFTSESMSVTTESFVLPPMPPFPSLGLERLERLRKCPKLKDVHEYWRRKSLEKKGANMSITLEPIMDSDDEQSTDFMNSIFVKEIEAFKRIESLVNELKVKTIQTDMFFKNLNETLSKELPKWVLNYQMRTKNIMRFIHKNYVSFSIEMHYEDKDQLGNNIFIQDVCLNTGRVPTKYWKPIDHILDFNLKVNLPLDLKTLLSGSKINVMEMLRHIDEICNKVAKDGLRLWRLVCQEEAAIVIDSNRIFVKKIEHFIEQGDSYRHPSVRKTEFRIEVNNIRCLSVKDIILPPVYTLSNELQFLPTGIDFIEKIIKSPSKYLKQ